MGIWERGNVSSWNTVNSVIIFLIIRIRPATETNDYHFLLDESSFKNFRLQLI